MKLFDRLYDFCFETVPVKGEKVEKKVENISFEEQDKFYLPCNVLFGNFKKQREQERKLRTK